MPFEVAQGRAMSRKVAQGREMPFEVAQGRAMSLRSRKDISIIVRLRISLGRDMSVESRKVAHFFRT